MSLVGRYRWSIHAWSPLSLLLAALATPSAAVDVRNGSSFLDSFGREVAPFTVALTASRTTLARELGEPVHFYGESLVPVVPVQGRPSDVVVPARVPAVRFCGVIPTASIGHLQVRDHEPRNHTMTAEPAVAAARLLHCPITSGKWRN